MRKVRLHDAHASARLQDAQTYLYHDVFQKKTSIKCRWQCGMKAGRASEVGVESHRSDAETVQHRAAQPTCILTLCVLG
jgi:hypothetical protein